MQGDNSNTKGQEKLGATVYPDRPKDPKIRQSLKVGRQEPDIDTATMPEHFAARDYQIAAKREDSLTVLLFHTIFPSVNLRLFNHHVRNERIDICRCLFA